MSSKRVINNISPSTGGVMRTTVTTPTVNVAKIRCQSFNDDIRKYITGIPLNYIPTYNLLWTCTNPGWGDSTTKLIKQFNKHDTDHAFSDLSNTGLVVLYVDMLIDSRMWRSSVPMNSATWNTLIRPDIVDNCFHDYNKMRELCIQDNERFPDPSRIHVVTPRHAELCGENFKNMSFDEINQVADENYEPILCIEIKRRDRAIGTTIDKNSFQATIGYIVKDVNSLNKNKNNKNKTMESNFTISVQLPCVSFLEYLKSKACTVFNTNLRCYQPQETSGTQQTNDAPSFKRKAEDSPDELEIDTQPMEDISPPIHKTTKKIPHIRKPSNRSQQK